MHVPFTRKEFQLALGKIGIDQRQRDAVEGEIPGGIPGVLPLIGHGDDIEVMQMFPVAVAAGPTLCGRSRHRRVAGEPLLDIIVVDLFVPEHTGQCLPLNGTIFHGEARVLDGRIEGVSLSDPLVKHGIERCTYAIG